MHVLIHRREPRPSARGLAGASQRARGRGGTANGAATGAGTGAARRDRSDVACACWPGPKMGDRAVRILLCLQTPVSTSTGARRLRGWLRRRTCCGTDIRRQP